MQILGRAHSVRPENCYFCSLSNNGGAEVVVDISRIYLAEAG